MGDRDWVKPPNIRCTTRFGSGKIDEIISPQTMLVDGVPCYAKDVHTCCTTSTWEDNEEDNIQFEDNPDPLLPLWISPEMLPTEPEEGMMESAGGDGGSGEEDRNKEVTPPILHRSTRQSPSPSHLCDSDIMGRGIVIEIITHKNDHTSVWPVR